MDFEKSYQRLNPAQRDAVDHIEGPVLVVAGPGTGKTQLLSMRVANILRQADIGPHNILCMTFTEDAAHNMRERLATIIGPAAYDVEIHTFHSFGASVIARNGEYFYQGIGTEPIDELSSHETFETIFRSLPPDNPLSTQFDGQFLFLKGAQSAIDNFKTAGLAPDEVRTIARDNMSFAGIVNPRIAEVMNGFARIDKTSLERFRKLRESLNYDALRHPSTAAQEFASEGASYSALSEGQASAERLLPQFIKPLNELIEDALTAALELSEQSGKTTNLTEFKNAFLVKNATGEWQLKDTDANKKLLALADIYEQYLLKLREANLIDFNDMITRVVHALETFDELRLNLQEQYQYILVDEFQDTSLAQLRLVTALTDNPTNEGRPNILAVGDDDQAIYSFQGAELSNILSYHQLYRDVRVITLTENYRSHQAVLDTAKFVIEPSAERLVQRLEGVTKDIVAKNTQLPTPHISHHRFASAEQQRQWIAKEIKECLNAGIPANEIAVLAAKHSGLRQIVPFLQAEDIPVRYDKRENILEAPAVAELLTMAELAVALQDNDQVSANALFPQVLSYEFWGLSTRQIWQLYLENYRKRSPWLQTALESGDARIAQIAEFFVALGMKASVTPLENMLDWLVGNEGVALQPGNGEQLALMSENFLSPFKAYYFSDENRRFRPNEYLELLSHLRFLRERLREFHTNEQLTLVDLVRYVALAQNAGIQLVDTTPHRERTDAVALHTAHSSKGREFGAVFIVDANHDIWTSQGGGLGKISMPANLPIERRSGSEEERRRLLYVAITRAKHHLVIAGYEAAKRGNAPLKYLAGKEEELPAGVLPQYHAATDQSVAEITEGLSTSWHDRHIRARTQPSMQEMLMPALERYSLSVTHLQRFLNVADGGPAQWFLQCLLHFPQASTPNMAFGNAVHATLESAQKAFKLTGERRAIDQLIDDFAQSLHRTRLDEATEKRLFEFGERILRQYFAARYDGFRQEEYFEFDLSSRRLTIEGVPVTGKIDRITPLDGPAVRVTDFKTGKPMHSWETSDPKRQIRLYHYQQQLAFYRLLLEESNAFGPGTQVTETAIEFVQPDASGELAPPLEYVPSDEEVRNLTLTLKGVWQAIASLELPDVTGYEQNLKGIQQFEADLRNSTNE